MTIGILIAAYDMFDASTLEVLRRLGERHEYLIAAVLSDEEVRELSGDAPVVPFWERQDIVGSVKCVSGVIPATPEMIAVCRPDAVYCASAQCPDWLVTLGESEEGVLNVKIEDQAAREADRGKERALERDRRRVGYASGAWDMFHIGHLNILRRAAEQCDYLIVGVATDDALFAMKAKHPVVALEERIAIVRSMTMVDEVVVDFSADKREVWERVRFDVIFKGDDWVGTPQGERLTAQMAELGVEVKYFPYTPNRSSTMLRRETESRQGRRP